MLWLNCLLIFILLPHMYESSHNNYLVDDILFKLHKVLDFVLDKYQEFNLDGTLGITLTQVNLRKILDLPELEFNIKYVLTQLMEKCETIIWKIWPQLPNNPPYMKTFRNKLLIPENWISAIKSHFSNGTLPDIGYYKNWSEKDILENKAAIYKNVPSDKCLREILELSRTQERCYVSDKCMEMMLDTKRLDKGYLLTHRLLYLQVAKLQNCSLPRNINLNYEKQLCTLISKEAKTNVKLGCPYHDIILEQVLLCGHEGFLEVMEILPLATVLQWQTPQGCFRNLDNDIMKRTSNVIDFGCTDHSTGLGAAILALYLRLSYVLKSNRTVLLPL